MDFLEHGFTVGLAAAFSVLQRALRNLGSVTRLYPGDIGDRLSLLSSNATSGVFSRSALSSDWPEAIRSSDSLIVGVGASPRPGCVEGLMAALGCVRTGK